jgi:hypothetical protein
MNEKEIGTAFNHSGTRISGKPLPDIWDKGLAKPSASDPRISRQLG